MTTRRPGARRSLPRWFRAVLFALIGVAAGQLVYAAILEHRSVRYLATPSLPGHWYRLAEMSPHRIERGAVVLACIPDVFDQIAAERGYYGQRRAGDCPPHHAAVAKTILAAAGDTVTLAPDGVRVNGARPSPLTAPLAIDTQGRGMPTLGSEPRCLATGEVWLSAPHPHSYDSRYYGPIPRAWIVGRLEPRAWPW